MNVIDCNRCEHLNITEFQQSNKKELHICTFYNKRVLHLSNNIEHSFEIYPCKECNDDNNLNSKLT